MKTYRIISPVLVLCSLPFLMGASKCGEDQVAAPVTPPMDIGVEYAIPGMAQAFATSGVRATKILNTFGDWENIEPQEGSWNWVQLDALIREYQDAGFENIEILLGAKSRWASRQYPGPFVRGDIFPKDAATLTKYQNFVTRVVERYDGDGNSDMPGLTRPILRYGVEHEFTGFWPGSAADYVTLLQTAYPAIRSASSNQAQVSLIAIMAIDVFQGNPSATTIASRWRTTPSYRKSLADTETILRACNYYDIVDFHSLGDYTEIPTTAGWLKSKLSSYGCPAKPIIVGDSYSMSTLIAFGLGGIAPIAFYPATESIKSNILGRLRSAIYPTDPYYQENQNWIYAEYARNIVKKAVVAAGEGIARINLGNSEDWRGLNNDFDRDITAPAIGSALFMGMMDRNLTARNVGGAPLPSSPDPGKVREPIPNTERPVFWAYSLLFDYLQGYQRVVKYSLGQNTWGYEFQYADGRRVAVVWYDTGAVIFPGGTASRKSITLSTGRTAVDTMVTPTADGDRGTRTRVATNSGSLTISISNTPTWIFMD